MLYLNRTQIDDGSAFCIGYTPTNRGPASSEIDDAVTQLAKEDVTLWFLINFRLFKIYKPPRCV